MAPPEPGTPDDPYGYLTVLRSALTAHEQASRQTGRTTRLIECVRDGDLIVTVDEHRAGLLQGLLRDAGKLGVLVRAERVSDQAAYVTCQRAKGRVFFDHRWQYAALTGVLREASRSAWARRV